MPNVCLVEDEEAIRDYLVQVLQRAGYGVSAYADAVSALPLIVEQPPDLLLTDLNLPGGMDGLALSEALHRSHPGLPVVIMSGASGGEVAFDRTQFLLEKPFRSRQLLDLLADLLKT
ncbi:MAG: hypothetical protein A2284_17940 [Deltaproteobacteria bacterium RIFOXYA12_FULL_61_11]|nr:MAG: hypothetical protein A2284_17940 [Deltaproteobacteria bacterium RIFOXYA12_FULL_61_11]